MTTASMWADLRPSTKAIDGLYLLDLTELSIESTDDIENIEFSLRVINSDTWEEIDTSDVITLSFG